MNFEYTVNPDLITKGETINRISRDQFLFPFPVKQNPVNDNDEFITLAIVADPEAVVNHLTGVEDSAYDDAATNIMVVHIPVDGGLDIGVELTPRQPYWQIPTDLGYVFPSSTTKILRVMRQNDMTGLRSVPQSLGNDPRHLSE